MTTLREAAQQALEALKDYKRSDAYRVSIAIHILSTALDQERAEPVAWMCPDDPERDTAFHWKAGHCENCGKKRIPLYTASPQRKPLTEEEINDLPLPPSYTATVRDFVRIVELAHGIGEEV